MKFVDKLEQYFKNYSVILYIHIHTHIYKDCSVILYTHTHTNTHTHTGACVHTCPSRGFSMMGMMYIGAPQNVFRQQDAQGEIVP